MTTSTTVFPDPRTLERPALPWISWACVVLIGVLAASEISKRPIPFEGWCVVAAIVALGLAGPVLELALGRAIYFFVLLLSAMAVLGIYMLTAGGASTDLNSLAGMAIVLFGVCGGLFTTCHVRPIYYLPKTLGRWHVSAFGIAVVGMLAVLVGQLTFDVSNWFVPLQNGGAGIVIGAILQRLDLARTEAFVSDGEGAIATGLAEVDRCIKAYRLGRARRILDRLRALHPRSEEVKLACYAAWKFDPGHAQFHAAAVALFDRAEQDERTTASIADMYRDYLAVTQGKPDLPIDLHLDLAKRFARDRRVDEASRIVNVYLQRDHKHSGLPPALLLLAESYVFLERPAKAAYYADTVVGLYPESLEAGLASRMRSQLAAQLS